MKRQILKAIVVIGIGTAGYFAWQSNRPPLSDVEINRLINDRQWEQAEREVRKLLARDPENNQALLLSVRIAEHHRDPDAVMAFANRIAPSSALRPQAILSAGELLWELNRGSQAEKYWLDAVRNELAIRKEPTKLCHEAWARLVDWYLLTELDEEARVYLWKLFATSEKRSAGAVDFLIRLTSVATSRENPEIAVGVLEKVVAADANDFTAAASLALHELRLGRRDAGEQRMRDIVGRFPKEPRVLEKWMTFLVEIRKRDELRQTLKSIPDGALPNHILFRFRGIDHSDHGEYAKAIEMYESVLKLAPNDDETRTRLAQTLRLHDKMDAFKKVRAEIAIQSENITRISRFLGKFSRTPGNELGPHLIEDLASICEDLKWYRESYAWRQMALIRDPRLRRSEEGIRRLESLAPMDELTLVFDHNRLLADEYKSAGAGSP